MDAKTPLYALMGPTASGKTGIAIDLACHHGFELISVDSVLVYRGLDIGSAKPSAAEQALAPHALIDIREFWQPYSAGDFRDDCAALVRGIVDRGHKPLLVGGTQLYFKALMDMNPDLPSADAGVRAQIRAHAATDGWPALHAQLAKVDPVSAARLHPNHSSRIERALEVHRLTGRALSDFHVPSTSSAYEFRSVALVPDDRAWLHRRIAQRFELMMRAGFEDEVRGLMAHPKFEPSLTSMSAVGYRQAIMGLSDGSERAQWVERAVIASRQLAKRQLTWLRGWPDLKVVAAETATTDAVLSAFSNFQ